MRVTLYLVPACLYACHLGHGYKIRFYKARTQGIGEGHSVIGLLEGVNNLHFYTVIICAIGAHPKA